jgi:hypothetical protein
VSWIKHNLPEGWPHHEDAGYWVGRGDPPPNWVHVAMGAVMGAAVMALILLP